MVLDSCLKTNLQHKIFHVPGGEIVFFCLLKPHHKRVRQFEKNGVKVLCFPSQKTLDLKTVLRRLKDLNVTSVLVEGGAGVFTSFLKAGKLVDEWQFIISPNLVGQKGVPSFNRADFKKIKLNQVVSMGPDTLLYCKIS